MGKASSNKKVARASRAAGRPGARKNFGWPLAIGAVVVVGVLLVVLSLGGGEKASGQPGIGDHWHAAYGVYDCDHYIAPFVDAAGDKEGIHTHGDGLMHIHPYLSRVTGKNANISAFARDVGMDLGDTSIKAPGIERENGDKCGGKAGRLELLVWDTPAVKQPRVLTKDIEKFAPQNNNVWALAFVAPGTDVPLPQSFANLQDPTAAEEGRQPAVHGSSTTVPGGTSPSTSTPPSDSTPTSAAP